MNLHHTEERCHGHNKQPAAPASCPERLTCRRHLQLGLDRQLGLHELPGVTIKVLTLPRVGRNECHYRKPA